MRTASTRDDVHGARGESSLLCRVGHRQCAIPIAHVVEIMRPLPVEPIAGATPFVSGVSIIRGEPVPVIDGAALMGLDEVAPARFVALRVAHRTAALAVTAVDGVITISGEARRGLPPLLADTRGEAIAAFAARDAELMFVLHTAHLIPDTAAIVAMPEGA